MKFLTQLPDDVLQNVLGMSRLAIHNMRRAWTSLSAEERKAKLQTERADLAKFLGCLNYRSQTIARIDGALYNLDLCKGRFCPVCSGKKGAVFRRKIERVICALYDKETRYLTPDGPKGPSVTIIVPKPEAEFPPAIKQALEKRRAATKVGSAVLLTLTISKGAGENRCEVLSKAVKNFKMRSQDPRRRAEYRELGICFSFSAYEQTFGIEGVHHHFHAMLVLNHCIEPNAEAELIFSKKIERLYLRELKAVLKDKWSEEYLLPCYKGQAYSCETIPTEFGETPIFYRWQQKHADEWRPCSEQDYKRLQRLKKCSRPILNIVTRDQDEAFATGLNEMSSAIESGKRKWRVCRRSPIKGGVSVQSEGGRQVLFRGRPSQTSRAEDIQFSLRP